MLFRSYLDPGSNYTLEYYYSMNSGFYGWYYDDLTFNGTEEIEFSIDVTDWDCSIQVYASLYNTTNGSYNHVYNGNWYYYNPECYDVMMDVYDDQGNYISYSDIDPGTTELLWIVNFDEDNIPDGVEFELDWYYIIDWEWSNQISGTHTWTNGNSSYLEVPWNITVTDFDCSVYAHANLRANTSDGWLAFGDVNDTVHAWVRYDHSVDNLYLGAGNVTRMTLEGATGDCGIGTTSPGHRLDVHDNVSSGYVAKFFNDGNSVTRYGIRIQCGADTGTTSGTTNYILAEDGDGGDTGVIRTVNGVFALAYLSDEEEHKLLADIIYKCASKESHAESAFKWLSFEAHLQCECLVVFITMSSFSTQNISY